MISFGIESANEDILSFYNKRIDLVKTEQLINYADEIGIYTIGNFIIGAPMETETSIEKTFNYIKRVPFDQVNIKILDYMKGSVIFEKLSVDITEGKRHLFACKENGLTAFPLSYLKNRIVQFTKEFNEDRKLHFIKKAKKFGLPYKLR